MKLWKCMFLAERYGRTRLALPEIAEQLNMGQSTIRNRRAKGEFQWIKADGRDLYADVEDVVSHLESQRQISCEATLA